MLARLCSLKHFPEHTVSRNPYALILNIQDPTKQTLHEKKLMELYVRGHISSSTFDSH